MEEAADMVAKVRGESRRMSILREFQAVFKAKGRRQRLVSARQVIVCRVERVFVLGVGMLDWVE